MTENLNQDESTHSAETPAACRRHSAGRRLIGLAGWLVAAGGAVSVAFIPMNVGESLCGIWGCFPPLQALVALHLLWAVGFAAMVWTLVTEKPSALLPVGGFLVLAAVATAAVILSRDVFYWFDHVPAEDHYHWPRRVGYTLATRIDLPILQLLAAGVVCIAVGRRSAPTPSLD